MATRRAWVLNLDADLELSALARGRCYAPTRRVLDAMARQRPLLAGALLGPGDVHVDEASPPGSARGLAGRAFCPTPRALALLARAGATPEPHPPAHVLLRVGSRAFSAGLGEALPGAAFVTDLDAARAKLAAPPPPAIASAWRVKRAYGMNGRGHRRVAPGALDEADLAYLRAGLAQGGVQIEADVMILREHAIHGVVAASGAVRLGRVVVQRIGARGVWLSSAPLSPSTGEDRALEARLAEEAARVAAALHAAGYFGAFGVDAFVYRGEGGAPRLQPRSEINARYTMGFAVGLPDLER